MTRFVAQSEPVIPDFGEASDCVQENRLFCPEWVRDNWADVLQPALLQHVKLTVIAVAIGFVIAFAAALVARRLSWFDRPFDLVSALLYTIPSLALFQLLVPITGLTVTTVEVALVSYTLLILFRNILTGLRSVPADVLEAARGMGMSSFQILRRVELRWRCRRSWPGCASRRCRPSLSPPSPRSSSRKASAARSSSPCGSSSTRS